MSSNNHTNRHKRRTAGAGGLWGALHARALGRRHRLSADVTREDDWETVDVPRIRMSRAIAVMLALHLIAVGGLFAFHLLGSDSSDTPQARPSAVAAAPGGGAPVTPGGTQPDSVPAATEHSVVDETPDTIGTPGDAGTAADDLLAGSEPKQYRIQENENKIAIAARNGVTPVDLDDANPGASFTAGTDIVIPRRRQVIAPAVPANDKTTVTEVMEPSSDNTHVVRNKFAINDSRMQEQDSLPDTAREEKPVRRAAPPERETVIARNTPATREEPRTEKTTRRTPPEKEKPVSKTVAKTEPRKPEAKKPAAGGRSVTVASGDTVYSLSKKLGVSANALMAANGIKDPSRLRIGQVLKRP